MSETEPTPTRDGYVERERRRQLTGNKREKMVPGVVLLAMRKLLILFVAKYARNRPFGYAGRPRLSPVQGDIKQAAGSKGEI
jgi:hypothetical protein